MRSIRSAIHRSPWRALGALLLATLVVACGGGGGVDTGGTGAPVQSFSTGRISGFGSVIVNDVHFDESAATIVDDDGIAHVAGDLQLGMTVQVEGGAIITDAGTDTLRSRASNVVFGSEIKGPVESVDTGAGTLRVLGQTVKVDVNTVFDGFANGLASIQPSNLVEVSAFFDATSGVFTATRVEHESQLAAYKLRGPISSLNTGTKTFAIGGATISYANIAAAQLPSLANGTLARVDLQTAQQGGSWVATRVRTVLPGVIEGARTEVEGYVTNFVSLASFKVDGVGVDASGAGVAFVKGDGTQVVNGARIEVEGRIQGGVLVATKLEFKKKNDGSNEQKEEFELDGAIESVNAAPQSFVVRGTTITLDANTEFTRGSAAGLTVGARVEVKGVLSGGHQLLATKIEVRP